MRYRRAGLVLVLLAFAGNTPSGAISGQSFFYVASPQLYCRGLSEPCPASELLVYDAQTLGLVTRIPLPQGSAQHTLAFSPDGGTLYAVGDKGTTVVNTTTHTATVLPIAGSFNGARQEVSAMRRDGLRLYIQAQNVFDELRQVNLTTGAITTFGTLAVNSLVGMAANPMTDRLYVIASPHTTPAGLIEFDTITEQEVRRITTAMGPVAASPDGTRVYTVTTAESTNRIVALSASTLSPIGSFEEGVAFRLAAGGRGRRLFSLTWTPTSADSVAARVRVFDAQALQSAPLSEATVTGATNLVASEDESRVFVGATVETSRIFDGSSLVITFANRVAVVDAQTGQVVRELPLPDSSERVFTPRQDPIAALATTPNNAPRCSYRVGPTQNAWTTAGGSTTITLTTGCAWVASSDASWVRLNQSSGTTTTTLTVTIDPAASSAARAATLTIGGQLVTISQAGFASTAPFGSIDTPVEGAGGISGSLAVTGWALDDAGVTGVRIFRDVVGGEAGGPIFLGNATLVEGARPDVAAAFPSSPLNTRAGWGLNVLTNMLPNQGNGTFRLYAYLDDVDGHTTVLGPRTFTSSNVNVTEPFGAIDTPGQGETVSGTIVNFGWALTPQPNTIPLDGSTIDVLIDGVVVGHPTYNNFRGDIAALFPGYQNSNGAVAYFTIDTTQYENGVHTIAWVVRDNAGNAAGIGSRYFTIQN